MQGPGQVHASAKGGANVTTSDTVANNFDALWIGGAGSGGLKITTPDGSVLTFAGVGVGWFPVETSLIWATGTDVTNIVGVYW